MWSCQRCVCWLVCVNLSGISDLVGCSSPSTLSKPHYYITLGWRFTIRCEGRSSEADTNLLVNPTASVVVAFTDYSPFVITLWRILNQCELHQHFLWDQESIYWILAESRSGLSTFLHLNWFHWMFKATKPSGYFEIESLLDFIP